MFCLRYVSLALYIYSGVYRNRFSSILCICQDFKDSRHRAADIMPTDLRSLKSPLVELKQPWNDIKGAHGAIQVMDAYSNKLEIILHRTLRVSDVEGLMTYHLTQELSHSSKSKIMRNICQSVSYAREVLWFLSIVSDS